MTAIIVWIKRNWKLPVLSLALTLLSYAVLSPSLSFYLDDWPQLYSLDIRGIEGIKQYFLFDGRPYGFWPDLLVYKIWGTNPLGWHLTNYALRWITGLFMWGTFINLWPQRKREISWAVLIFAVFPLFVQQSMGTTFIAHWFCYALFFLSLFLMVLAVRHKRSAVWLIALSFLVNIPNLFTYENFIGVEFVRPLILWFALSDEKNVKKRLVQGLFYWLPFLILDGVYIYWRLFVMDNLRAGTEPILFYNLYHQPLTTALQLGTFILRDTLHMIVSVWYPTLDPYTIDLTVPAKILANVLTVLVIVTGVFVLLRKKMGLSEAEERKSDSFPLQAMLIGLAGIILGVAPGWIIMRTVSGTSGLWDDRFGLPAMWASSIFLVGLIAYLFKRHPVRGEILLVILIGLAVGRNLAVTNEYRWATVYQNRFFSQLKWRAPYLQPKTTLLADNEMFPKMGVYPTAFALNMFYPTASAMPEVDYWFFTLHKYFPDTIDQLADGIPVTADKWFAKYGADSRNSLVIAWNFDKSNCVWVLTENDRYIPTLSENTVAALGVSNLGRIDPTADDHLPSRNLFGREDRNTWCYYYEKADLARQQGDWQTITQLFDESVQQDLSPDNGVELMPFIEAYARQGNADQSMELTKMATHLTDNLTPFLCDNWNRFAKDLQKDDGVQRAYDDFSAEYGCSSYQ
jgi:hypothetical protein